MTRVSDKLPSRERMRRLVLDMLGQAGSPDDSAGFQTMLFKMFGWESTLDVLALFMELHAAGRLTEKSAALALKGLARG